MTKYTDEEIIAYLKTLREGDVLTAVGGRDDITIGKRYTIEKDSDGDIFIEDDDGGDNYVRINVDYEYNVARLFRGGIFEIPSQSSAPFYASIRQTVEIESGDKPYKSVSVRVDDAGFAELEALESRSFDSRLLADLYAKRDELQAQIDALEAV